MPDSRLWLVNSDGKVYTLSTRSRHLQDVSVTINGRSKEFKRISALSQCCWALGSDHRLYVYVPSSDIPLRVQEVTYENERWTPGVGWTGKSIVPNARKNWSDINGQGYHPKENFELPSCNWEWEGQWQVDENMGGEVSGLVGWQYAANWIGKFSAEMTWKTFVRRRKWVRYRRYTCCDSWAQVSTLGDEMGDPSELFLDVSVGGQDLSCQVEGQLCVWAVSITGQVYIRLGVSAECPEGHTWRHVPAGQHGDSGVIEVSVGSTGQVWLVSWDGQALVRTNISSETPYGTVWVKVPAPVGHPILQVSVGRQTVWAISREGKIWFWKSGGEVYDGNWVEMVGHMSLLSVSQNDQVFGIGLDDTLIHIRTSVTPELLTGKTWEPLTILEPRKAEFEGSLGSSVSGSLQSSQSFLASSSQHSFPTSYKTMTPQQHNNMNISNVNISNSTLPNLSGGNSSQLHLPSQSHVTSHNISKSQPNQSLSTISHGGRDKNTSTNSENVDECLLPGDTNTMDHDIKNNKSRNLEDQRQYQNDKYNNIIDNCDEADVESEVKENLVIKSKQVISQGSMELDSLTSTSSDCVDFVTDLLSSNEKQQMYVKSEEDETCNFVTDLLGEKYKRGEVEGPDFNKKGERETCDLKDGTRIRDIQLGESKETTETLKSRGVIAVDKIDSSTVRTDVNTVEAGQIVEELSSAVFVISQPGQDYTTDTEIERSDSVTGVNMNWIWVSATACHVEDTASLPWVQSSKKIVAESEPPIDEGLRQSLVHQLRQRNKVAEKFLNYEEAVEKTVWVKRGHLHLKLNTRRESDWVNCELELEQGLRGNTSQTGLLFLHFSQQGKQMHIQLSLADIVCVCRITVINSKSAFAIYLTEDVQAKRKPYILSAASEKETNDWVASISVACSSLRGETQGLDKALCWAVTDRGEVFVHQPSSQPQQLAHMYWQQVGGHMLLVKTNTEGITWAISHDHTAYVYTGGYGGGIFKGISTMCRDVYPQTDVRQMYIYENQKWHLLTGFSPRYLLANKYGWTDETGKIPMTQQSIQTPSSSWQWIGDWTVDFSTPGGVDPDGWQYSSAFPRTQDFHNQAGWRDSYRRRRWLRRCKLTTSGPWLPVGPLPIIDVSIQPAHSSQRKTTSVWAVGANGDALCRVGVTPDKPQGDAWVHVPADQPFLAVSIGGNYWLWAVARDGSVWFRSGVSPDLPTGKVWLQVVPSPPGGAPLQQISVGDNSVWAVDANENLWRRKDTSLIFPEGTEWELVSKHVQNVSAGHGDEVWVVRQREISRKSHVKGVLSKRLGISTERTLGTGWQDGIGGVWNEVCLGGVRKTLHKTDGN